MKTFIHHDIPKLVRVDSDGGRLYQTPDGNAYPSVTTVVGQHKAKHIQEWRNRVGHEQANQISKKASKRGTAVHTLCEDYLKTGYAKPSLPDVEVFNSIKPFLDKINNIHCLETQLYSHHLKVAGTVDCIAEYEGKLHVIDFKTASKPKQRDWIHDYFMLGVDDHDPLIFQEKRNDWIFKFRELRDQFSAL